MRVGNGVPKLAIHHLVEGSDESKQSPKSGRFLPPLAAASLRVHVEEPESFRSRITALPEVRIHAQVHAPAHPHAPALRAEDLTRPPAPTPEKSAIRKALAAVRAPSRASTRSLEEPTRNERPLFRVRASTIDARSPPSFQALGKPKASFDTSSSSSSFSSSSACSASSISLMDDSVDAASDVDVGREAVWLSGPDPSMCVLQILPRPPLSPDEAERKARQRPPLSPGEAARKALRELAHRNSFREKKKKTTTSAIALWTRPSSPVTEDDAPSPLSSLASTPACSPPSASASASASVATTPSTNGHVSTSASPSASAEAPSPKLSWRRLFRGRQADKLPTLPAAPPLSPPSVPMSSPRPLPWHVVSSTCF